MNHEERDRYTDDSSIDDLMFLGHSVGIPPYLTIFRLFLLKHKEKRVKI